MAGEKLSIQQETTVTNGTYFYTIIPGLLGLFLSRKISWVNLFKPVTDRLVALESIQGNFASVKYSNKGTAFTHSLLANSKVESIDFRVISGSPVVKVGTTVGGEEVLPEISLTAGTDSNNLIMTSYEAATIIYFTVTGGYLNTTITVKSSIL
jgi:hypothetical protein